MYIHEYLPVAPRALWLDADVVVRACVGPLYGMRLEQPVAFAEDLSIDSDGTGLNVGVMLADLQHFREEALHLAFEGLIAKWIQEDFGFCDQTVLEETFAERHDTLDWRWNVVGMGAMLDSSPNRPIRIRVIQIANSLMQAQCLEEAHILHFNWGGPNGSKYYLSNGSFMQPYLAPQPPFPECHAFA